MIRQTVWLVLISLASNAFAQATSFSSATTTAVKGATCEEASQDVIFRITMIYPEVIGAFLDEPLTEAQKALLRTLLEEVEREGTVITVFSASLRTSHDDRERVEVDLPGYSVSPLRYRFGFEEDKVYGPLKAQNLSEEKSMTLSLSEISQESPHLVLNFGAYPEVFTVGAAYLFGPFFSQIYVEGQSKPVERQQGPIRCLYSPSDGILGNAAGGGTSVISQAYYEALLSDLVQLDSMPTE